MKILSLVTLMVLLALSACSPFQSASASGEKPAPIIESAVPNEPASVSPDRSPTTGYEPVNVVDVYVEMGVGSPIPVFVDVGADLPDVCAQVEYVDVVQDGSIFKINLGTTPSSEADCLRDTFPFRLKIPLNVIGLPAGTYSVDVNGVRSEFKLDSEASTTDLHTADMSIVKQEIQVDDVSIQIGRGSPLPVHAVVSANLPNACSQLGEIQMHEEQGNYYVRLIAYVPAQTNCNPDTLPIRVELPLNIFFTPEGSYEVIVNGMSTDYNIPIY